jgi:hypothetical protein
LDDGNRFGDVGGGALNRFDYLHDPRPLFVERLQTARLPRRLYTVVGAIGMLLCVMVIGYTVETIRIEEATAIEERAQARFDRSRVALANVQLAWQHIDTLIAQDRRLHEIRLSSSAVAARLARTGNLFTPHIWLTSLTSEENGHLLKGSAESLPAVDAALGRLLHDARLGEPHLMRVYHDGAQDRSPLLSFELRLDDAP